MALVVPKFKKEIQTVAHLSTDHSKKQWLVERWGQQNLNLELLFEFCFRNRIFGILFIYFESLFICLFVYLHIYFLFRWESSHRPANVRLARMADIPGLYPSKKCWGGKNIRHGFCPIQNASAPCHQIWIWRLESLGWYPCYCTLKGKKEPVALSRKDLRR